MSMGTLEFFSPASLSLQRQGGPGRFKRRKVPRCGGAGLGRGSACFAGSSGHSGWSCSTHLSHPAHPPYEHTLLAPLASAWPCYLIPTSHPPKPVTCIVARAFYQTPLPTLSLSVFHLAVVVILYNRLGLPPPLLRTSSGFSSSPSEQNPKSSLGFQGPTKSGACRPPRVSSPLVPRTRLLVPALLFPLPGRLFPRYLPSFPFFSHSVSTCLKEYSTVSSFPT